MTAVVEKKYLSASDFQRDIWRLASAIRKSGWRPDWLIGLWRGGSPVAIAVHEFLKVSGWSVRHAPLKCWSYTGIGECSSEVEFLFGEEVFGLFKPGERILFVDDVFDTGGTARAVAERMRGTGAEMRYACVYWKSAKNETNLRPDYFVRDTGDDWIVFPHEIEGLTEEEVRQKDPVLDELLAK